MTGEPAVTLESLDYEWGDAYLICYARDQWAALRRDTRRFLTASTLDGLAAAIDADYKASPVPRELDPPGTDGYLTPPRTHEVPGPGRGQAGAADGAAGRVPALEHQLLPVLPGLDRPQRHRDHLPGHARAAVFALTLIERTRPGEAPAGTSPRFRWLTR